MKLRASLKRKTVHVFRQKVKETTFVNIKYSKQIVNSSSKSIIVIVVNQL
jgi:predicted fused transcriptional regulator/phosphomethylpyrimidine kinase